MIIFSRGYFLSYFNQCSVKLNCKLEVIAGKNYQNNYDLFCSNDEAFLKKFDLVVTSFFYCIFDFLISFLVFCVVFSSFFFFVFHLLCFFVFSVFLFRLLCFFPFFFVFSVFFLFFFFCAFSFVFLFLSQLLHIRIALLLITPMTMIKGLLLLLQEEGSGSNQMIGGMKIASMQRGMHRNRSKMATLKSNVVQNRP